MSDRCHSDGSTSTGQKSDTPEFDGGQLIVGETTIKTRVTRVLTKLGVRDRVQAIVFAHESGLADPRRAGVSPLGPPDSEALDR